MTADFLNQLLWVLLFFSELGPDSWQKELKMVRFVLICDFKIFSPLGLVRQAGAKQVPQDVSEIGKGEWHCWQLCQCPYPVGWSHPSSWWVFSPQLASMENTQGHTYRFASTNPQGDSRHTDNQG